MRYKKLPRRNDGSGSKCWGRVSRLQQNNVRGGKTPPQQNKLFNKLIKIEA